jgi:hypothetical protein
MLTLDRTLAERSNTAESAAPLTTPLDAAQRARLRSLLGQAEPQDPQAELDPQVRRWMPLAVPLLGVLLAASILLIWATVL